MSRLAAAVLWGVATTASHRAFVVELGGVTVLEELLWRTIKADGPSEEEMAQRDQTQAFALGALSVLLVDARCRTQFLKNEPDFRSILTCCAVLPQYGDGFQAERRSLAAKILTSCVQRDAAVRHSIIDQVSAYFFKNK